MMFNVFTKFYMFSNRRLSQAVRAAMKRFKLALVAFASKSFNSSSVHNLQEVLLFVRPMHSCLTFLVVRIYPHSTLNKKQKGKIIDAIISVTREQHDLRKESVFFPASSPLCQNCPSLQACMTWNSGRVSTYFLIAINIKVFLLFLSTFLLLWRPANVK